MSLRQSDIASEHKYRESVQGQEGLAESGARKNDVPFGAVEGIHDGKFVQRRRKLRIRT
jgi:hypothetical protein